MKGRVWPVAIALAVVLALWYPAAALLNHDQAAALAEDDAAPADILRASLSLDRPLLPAPHQILGELVDTILFQPPGSPRSLLHHAGVTAGAAAAGFALALLAGVGLASGIVHSRTLDRALMPWLVASQAVPVLAIAPMVIIVLGNVGVTGLLPKALVAGYLSFLPIALGMVTGLRSPEPMLRDLLRTYGAGPWALFAKLRWPASLAHLFPSLTVAAALALTGAIVAELPTGAQAGLGARLLAGSYYGQTLQIWAALVVAALLAVLATAGVALVRHAVVRARGGRL